MANKDKYTEQKCYNSECLVQGHEDKEKNYFIHASETIIYINLRLLCSLVAKFGFHIWNRDVTQVYIERHPVKRKSYVKTVP